MSPALKSWARVGDRTGDAFLADNDAFAASHDFSLPRGLAPPYPGVLQHPDPKPHPQTNL